MKTLQDITREDFEQMEIHHRKYQYNADEAMGVVNLVRLYINDRQASCVTCTNSLREAKTLLNEFYTNNREKMLSILEEKEKIVDVVVETPTKEITEEDVDKALDVKPKKKR